MMKTLRTILFFLLLLGVAAVFYLEPKLQLSTGGHELVQILITAFICWLALRWVIFDETRKYREPRKLAPAQVHYRHAASLEDVETMQYKPAGQRNSDTAKTINGRLAPLPRMRTMSAPPIAQALISVGIVFAQALIMRWIGPKTIGEGVIAILYLLPIGWCTVRWGKIAGVSAALTAALTFDYLFIPPYGTFNIGSLEGWLLLFLFIATATLVVGRIQAILTEERERERKATFLVEIMTAVANLPTREGIAQAIANHVQQKFQADVVQVHLRGGWGYQTFTARADNGEAALPDGKPDRALTIASGPAVIGEIDIWQGRVRLPSEDDPMLQTLVNQTVAALERMRLAQELVC